MSQKIVKLNKQLQSRSLHFKAKFRDFFKNLRLNFLLLLIFIGVQWLYSVALVSRCRARWISHTYSFIRSFLDFLPFRSPQSTVLPSRFSLVNCFILRSVHMLVPLSRLTPTPFPLVIRLFSTSVTLFLLSTPVSL